MAYQGHLLSLLNGGGFSPLPDFQGPAVGLGYKVEADQELLVPLRPSILQPQDHRATLFWGGVFPERGEAAIGPASQTFLPPPHFPPPAASPMVNGKLLPHKPPFWGEGDRQPGHPAKRPGSLRITLEPRSRCPPPRAEKGESWASHLETRQYFTSLGRISLEIMTLQPRCEDVETAEGVALTVTGVAQVQYLQRLFSGMHVSALTFLPSLPARRQRSPGRRGRGPSFARAGEGGLLHSPRHRPTLHNGHVSGGTPGGCFFLFAVTKRVLPSARHRERPPAAESTSLDYETGPGAGRTAWTSSSAPVF